MQGTMGGSFVLHIFHIDDNRLGLLVMHLT